MITYKTTSAQEIYAFRRDILWPNKPIKHVIIEGDDKAMHIGAYECDKLVGVGSFFLDTPRARLRKFGVLPKYQKRGIGTGLLHHAAQTLLPRGIEILWCDARQDAGKFYSKLGFVVDDEVFLKSGVSYTKAFIKLHELAHSSPAHDMYKLLEQQAEFINITDQLKQVTRLNRLHDGSRVETTAEHSWHVALQAILMKNFAPAYIKIDRVVKLLLTHDLVEILAGDHWLTQDNQKTIEEDERKAAKAIFSMLPQPQQDEFTQYWDEFHLKKTLEAKFAHAMDALHPMILAWGPNGNGVTHKRLSAAKMKARKKEALEPFPLLWQYALKMLDEAVVKGLLDD